ncbi:MAG: CoB--CoM heterodisulfide reductase iron-sulfur subunit A family protein [Chitinispirillaceae bacterium]|nr:CoB--CoM heterodisulfide reductase iron-sulfur subunit A family protein [Chitinispirillaceae bacterium]
MHKRAMVIGGGVAGIQAALDLAEMGVETFLVEKGPSIGGRMAQLDKTFPTNDCAMCILSPKLVSAGSHPYLSIITNAEVVGIEGNAPDLKVRILKKPRYVKEDACTGCGICVSKCPTKIPDPYNKGLSQTKAIRIPFPQAVPAVAVIDAENCRYLKEGKCRVCEKVCGTNAIDFSQTEELIDLKVGSVILSCGTTEFDVKLKGEYGYGIFPNVLTSIEYERILSASGPSAGHITRPSDHKEPKKIAILQCVGSRDVQAGNEHCSAICCMQAAKDAIITQEHLPGAQTTIFYMDIRAYGKNFDRFIDKAKDQHRTKFINARIASVESDPVDNDLRIHYMMQNGGMAVDTFDLLILSSGIQPSEASKSAARNINVNLDGTGFVSVDTMEPVNTNRNGIFACGSVSGPKDIPESVVEASGAASAAATVLSSLPVKEIVEEKTEQRDLRGEPPRIGVYVCRCGINIASVVDVPEVVKYAATLPGVKFAGELMFSCAQDSQKVIRNAIREYNLNRLVVAACTPRTHEPLFQKTLEEAGINPYLFEFANIREHCSWVHQGEPEQATRKACDLLRAASAKVRLAQPLFKKQMGVTKSALVIGGGLAGMTCALDLADQDYPVHLVEKSGELGGNLLHVHTTLAGKETGTKLALLIEKVMVHDRITTHLNAAIESVDGYVGNFRTKLEGNDAVIEHGVVIVATGADENHPEEYGYGKSDRVITQRQLEEMLHDSDEKNDGTFTDTITSVAMIQCVGSRDDRHGYCSRVCCSNAVKNAIALKERNPLLKVYVIFRDIRTYGLREARYRKAREAGVLFIRYDLDAKPVVVQDGDAVIVSVQDVMLGKTVSISPDLLVLSTGIVSNPDNRQLSQFLKVPLDSDGFFLEAHVKLRPVDFATDGVFVCGLAHYPKDIGETIAQARAAAGRAATVLSKQSLESEGKTSKIREELCCGCQTCISVCAYNAIEYDAVKNVAVVNETLCKGCGACAASCRSGAIDLNGFSNEQILSMLDVLV